LTLRVGWLLEAIRQFGSLEENMEWTTPQFDEVSLNCEINSYASAEM
jgi:coenzyme PQQ precursor peptide PqqA